MTHRIVCTDQVPAPRHGGRIVAVGVGEDPARATERLTLEQVIASMDQGNVFYTKGPLTTRIAVVQKYWCQDCSGWHIRSAPDAVADNNLDSLRACNWQS